MNGETFYVGYHSTAPMPLARHLRRVALGLVLGAVILGAGLAAAQHPFDPGSFDWGVERQLRGTIVENPYPMLRVERPHSDEASLYLLTVFGKHSAAPLIAGLDGRRVRLTGSLIHRDQQVMLQIAAAGVEVLPGPPTRLATRQLGRLTVRGEIVDSKCFLGTMKPGRRKPHRACAVRCIAGGAPPALWTGHGGADGRVFLLTGAAGEPIGSQLSDRVAEPIEVTGRVERRGNLLVLAAPLEAFRRVESFP